MGSIDKLTSTIYRTLKSCDVELPFEESELENRAAELVATSLEYVSKRINEVADTPIPMRRRMLIRLLIDESYLDHFKWKEKRKINKLVEKTTELSKLILDEHRSEVIDAYIDLINNTCDGSGYTIAAMIVENPENVVELFTKTKFKKKSKGKDYNKFRETLEKQVKRYQNKNLLGMEGALGHAAIVSFAAAFIANKYVQTPQLYEVTKDLFKTASYIQNAGIIAGALSAMSAGLFMQDAKVRDLKTTGAYGIVRNPMWMGFFVAAAATFLKDPSVLNLGGVLSFMYFANEKNKCEEIKLEREFGQKYSDYKNEVNRYIPFLNKILKLPSKQ